MITETISFISPMSYSSIRRKPLPDEYIQQHELINKHGVPAKQHNPTFSSKEGVWRSWQRVLTNTWLVEHTCLLTGCALLATIVVLASYFDNRSIADWTAALSFNTILSVLATVLKGALVLPTASALGQLKWLDTRSGLGRPLTPSESTVTHPVVQLER